MARAADGSVDVEVIDTGTWRPPPADRGFRGRGLELISALAQDVEVTHGPDGPAAGGTRVRFRFLAETGEDAAAAPAGAAVRGIFPATEGGPARLVESEEAGEVRLAVEGELDVASVGPLGTQLARRLGELAPGVPVVLDLGPTSYLASAGVGLVLEAQALAAAIGVPFRVRTAAGSPPRRILDLAGLTEFLTGSPITRSGGDGDRPR